MKNYDVRTFISPYTCWVTRRSFYWNGIEWYRIHESLLTLKVHIMLWPDFLWIFFSERVNGKWRWFIGVKFSTILIFFIFTLRFMDEKSQTPRFKKTFLNLNFNKNSWNSFWSFLLNGRTASKWQIIKAFSITQKALKLQMSRKVIAKLAEHCQWH